MILSEVTYDSNAGYELHYVCHNCERAIPDNRFEYCPHCGVKFVKHGSPEKLELDKGDIVLLEDFAESKIQAVQFEDGDVLIVHDCLAFNEKGGKQ